MLNKRIGIKLYRKLRYRKGHGVHSPFMYNLITRVIEEKASYYIFEDIEKERIRLISQKNKISVVTKTETQSKNYGALLFRLVNFFKPDNVLQIGSTTGIMSLYLAGASKDCKCYCLEERPDLFYPDGFIEKHPLDNIIRKEGYYETLLKKLEAELPEAGLIHINLHGDVERTKNILKHVVPFIGEKTVLLIDGIGLNKPMRKLWSNLIQYPSVSISLDLYAIGMIFFNKRYYKQHFKNYIDYDKQNLYKKGRRRFHFSGRRKKSFKK